MRGAIVLSTPLNHTMKGLTMMRAHRILIATGLLLAAGLVYGQSPTPAPAMPEILKCAMRFEGKWESNVTMLMDGKTSKFKYAVKCRKIADGQGLYMDEDANIPGMGRLIGSDLIGYDPFEGKLHLYSVDNQGTTHDHIGELISPDHLRIVHESMRDGKPFKEVLDFEWKSSKSMGFALEATLDGKSFQSITGVFSRKGK